MNNPHQPHAKQAHEEDLDQFELVSDPARILASITQIHERLAVIGVRLESNGPLFDAHLVRLDDDSQTLFLAPLEPADEIPPLQPGQEIHIFATMGGVAVRFSTTILDSRATEHGPLYSGAYPSQLLYLQRRGLFRVRLPAYDRRSIKIRPLNAVHSISARIIDLSVRGFCLDIEASAIQPSQIGEVFDYLGMTLPGTRGKFSGEAILVNLRASPTPNHLSAGFSIQDIDPPTERALMRAALYFQRELRKLSH